VKPTSSPQDEEIIELLKRLGTLKAEYPAELLAARRAAFAAQIEQQKSKGASEGKTLSQEQVLELLESLKPAQAEYPPALLAARRASFISQIEQRSNGHAPEEEPQQDQLTELLGNLKSAPADYPAEWLSARRAAFIAKIKQTNNGQVPEELPSRDQVMELLRTLKSARAEYPSELLSARRAAFLAQIEQYNRISAQTEQLPTHNGSIHKLFGGLKSLEMAYPRRLWSARRSVFVAQIREGKVTVLEALRAAIHNMFNRQRKNPAPAVSFRRTAMVLATLLLTAAVGSLAYQNRRPLTQIFESSSAQPGGPFPSPLAAVTSTGAIAQVICKPGYLPPLCLAQEFDQSSDLTFPGNGRARPAVAKDTIPGYSRIHQAAYANDGLYGPGASWISNSAYSWIKIDLGDVRTINTITFGRDRLGNLNDGDPGQFVIAVALSDDVYADGNSQNDFIEYTQVYESEDAGFDGTISGPETIEAKFDPVTARFVKITFENAGTAVDEIEAFMIQPFGLASSPTQRLRDTRVPSSFTPVPTNTLIPSRTPTLIPTNTLIPTRTPTLIPTNTPFPTDTATPRPTNTPRPTHTPRPTNTDAPTDTPEPPTDTPEPPPTHTPEPPTDTPEPPPTNTAEPPASSTAEPLLVSTQTPESLTP
jgi:hypothetical protein